MNGDTHPEAERAEVRIEERTGRDALRLASDCRPDQAFGRLWFEICQDQPRPQQISPGGRCRARCTARCGSDFQQGEASRVPMSPEWAARPVLTTAGGKALRCIRREHT